MMHRGRNSVRRWPISAACLAAVIALTAACSSQASSSSAGDASSGSVSGSGCHFDKPVLLGFNWEIAGESAAAIPDFQNGALLAVQHINADGGICGQQVSWTRVPSSVFSSTLAAQQFLQLAQRQPAFIIGLDGAPTIGGVMRDVNQAGIPVLAPITADNVLYGTQLGSKYLYLGFPTLKSYIKATLEYIKDDLHLTRIALMGGQDPYGEDMIQDANQLAASAGVQIVTTQTFPETATDLTSQVLAVKRANAQAVIDYSYPAPSALQMNQFVQNGIDIPTVSSNSADIAARGGLINAAAVKNLYTVMSCNVSDPAPAIQSFVKAYTSKYHIAAGYYAIETYDMVNIAAQAIKAAGSTNASAILAKLGSMTFTGLCDPAYKADGSHTISHQLVVQTYANPKAPKTVDTITTPPNPVAS
jgi:branched-chain amino acid transport system substrate-binding protein